MTTQTNIPIQNIYYLLAYAWDQFREGSQHDICPTACPDSVNLLAHLLAMGVSRLATRGMDKSYELFEEETPRIRGRFDLVGSYRRGTHLAGRLKCEFDELTADTLPNQIIKSTCVRLRRSLRQLSKENRRNIHQADELLHDISTIQLSRRVFHRVQLHRNNRHYRFLLSICELLHDCYLPTEEQGGGRFADLLRNDVRMHQLFERFVLQFARRHCPGARIRAMPIQWVGEWDDEVDEVLPRMLTDVTIEYPDHKTILDCKFYREALLTRKGRHRLHSSHLYQLNAYLQNMACHEGWQDVRGILLYPAVNHHLNLKCKLLGHQIEVRSIDLDQPWQGIHEQLLGIVSKVP